MVDTTPYQLVVSEEFIEALGLSILIIDRLRWEPDPDLASPRDLDRIRANLRAARRQVENERDRRLAAEVRARPLKDPPLPREERRKNWPSRHKQKKGAIL